MGTLRAGVIGLGVGRHHVRAFDAHPGCEVRRVCDIDEGKLTEIGEQYPAIDTCTKAEGILEDDEIDIVSVASYDDVHFEQVMGALERGKHVFVEKPLCLYPQQAREIWEMLGQKKGLRLSCNLNLRTCPLFRKVREEIQGGAFGRIISIEGDYLWGRAFKLTDGWRGRMDFYSIIYGAAIHIVDLIVWMTGKKPTRVSCMGNQVGTQGSGFGFRDFAAMILQFENDMVSVVTANAGCRHPHFHKISVYGTEKSFFHDLESTYEVRGDDREHVIDAIDAEYPGREKDGMIHNFIETILDPRTEAMVDVQDIFDVMQICFAAERAADSRESVTIDYF